MARPLESFFVKLAAEKINDRKTRRIAITGGPGSGKTTILERLTQERPDKLLLVKEASTFFLNQLPLARHYQSQEREIYQSLIYQWQHIREASAALQADGRLLVSDRGTLDGAAYWPGPLEQFLERQGTTLDGELSRYCAVIHLEVPCRDYYESSLHTNRVRKEDWDDAKRLCDREKEIWSRHPELITVSYEEDFQVKQAQVRAHLDRFLH